MLPFGFWQRWLLAVSCLVVLFGLSLGILNQTAVFSLVFNNRIDPLFWADGSPTAAARAFQQWIYGVLGATVAGWGITLTFIAAKPFARKESWSWHCLSLSVALWFMIDSAVSLAFGIDINVAFNAA